MRFRAARQRAVGRCSLLAVHALAWGPLPRRTYHISRFSSRLSESKVIFATQRPNLRLMANYRKV
jgi:hypothetical protein